MKQDRLNKVLKAMEERNIPQMIVSDPAGIFYLTGRWIHPGERLLALYINLKGDYKLFVNELFPISEDLGVEKIFYNDVQSPVEIMVNHMQKDKKIGIDKNWPARFLIKLMELKGASEFVLCDIVDRCRMSKDEEEKNLMREASKLNDIAVDKMINMVPEELSEIKMGQKLGEVYEKLGAEGFSFDPIIAYGPNAADPHHETDNSTVKPGDSVIIDIGCVKNSYCSDMTRTVFYKEVSEKAKEVYNTVLEANLRGIAAVKPGARFCDIDAAARNYIEEKGYGKYFTHRTGHSIGIECHDLGDVSSINTEEIKPGMIFSVEPGIYIPGEVGVRIEDLVLVTEDGCEILNKYSKELRIVE